MKKEYFKEGKSNEINSQFAEDNFCVVHEGGNDMMNHFIIMTLRGDIQNEEDL